MSKLIKVELAVYDELAGLREKGETFSLVVKKLLSARRYILVSMENLETDLKVKQYRAAQAARQLAPPAAAVASAPAAMIVEGTTP